MTARRSSLGGAEFVVSLRRRHHRRRDRTDHDLIADLDLAHQRCKRDIAGGGRDYPDEVVTGGDLIADVDVTRGLQHSHRSGHVAAPTVDASNEFLTGVAAFGEAHREINQLLTSLSRDGLVGELSAHARHARTNALALVGGIDDAWPRERRIDHAVDRLDRGVGTKKETTESGDEGVTVACVDVEKERLAIHPLDSEPGVELARRLQDEDQATSPAASDSMSWLIWPWR